MSLVSKSKVFALLCCLGFSSSQAIMPNPSWFGIQPHTIVPLTVISVIYGLVKDSNRKQEAAKESKEEVVVVEKEAK